MSDDQKHKVTITCMYAEKQSELISSSGQLKLQMQLALALHWIYHKL